MRAEHLDLALPGKGTTSGKTIVADAALTIEPGERLLVTGPSGSGKSTLFRALAGIWPYGRGQIRIPQGARVLFLPQKPYIPIAPLRDAVAYPGQPGEFPDDAVRRVLGEVGLEALAARIDEHDNWSMRLSGGEQQRLAIARALLHAPDWLFLDEATAWLDEASARRLYELLAARLPRAAIVSIAHRPTVAPFHARRMSFVPRGETMALAATPRSGSHNSKGCVRENATLWRFWL